MSMQNLDTSLNHLLCNYPLIYNNSHSSSNTPSTASLLTYWGKQSLHGFFRKFCCSSQITAGTILSLLTACIIFFSYQILLAFISHIKGHRINFVINITQYQAQCMYAFRKSCKGRSILGCLTDKQCFKAKKSLQSP